MYVYIYSRHVPRIVILNDVMRFERHVIDAVTIMAYCSLSQCTYRESIE